MKKDFMNLFFKYKQLNLTERFHDTSSQLAKFYQ